MDCCTYANPEKRIYYLSDDVDNQSIGVLTAFLPPPVREKFPFPKRRYLSFGGSSRS